MNNQWSIPLLNKLEQFSENNPFSFHVPGHKNGRIFPKEAQTFFSNLLPIDLTELSGLDDLHGAHGVIKEAQQLATEFFKADDTFFLVGGSTVGNLAMILAACSPGDKIIVQRNCHKSIMNGLELANAHPIFIAPAYDRQVDRYTQPSYETLKQAIQENPDAKAVVLTYPDYFGRTYPIKNMIELAHQHHMAVLVDEAHGVHFSLGKPFPASALELGADIVVQSAHKMAPAMTMASFLHIKSNRIQKEKVAHYLQVLQSSSPSYPLLASLDVARYFLATMSSETIEKIIHSVNYFRSLMETLEHSNVLPVTNIDDPTKLTLHIEMGIPGYKVASIFEEAGIYPELSTHNQILFIHGLAPLLRFNDLKNSLKRVNEQLKNSESHDIIDICNLFPQSIQQLVLSYQMMDRLLTKVVSLEDAAGCVAAEAIIPYPPGIPFVLKGEIVTHEHIFILNELITRGVTIQHRHIQQGIKVFI